VVLLNFELLSNQLVGVVHLLSIDKIGIRVSVNKATIVTVRMRRRASVDLRDVQIWEGPKK
jgi:hypothetical protein